MAIKDLAVAYNGSANSKAALSFAIQMCKKYDAALTGLHVHTPLDLEPQLRRWTPENVLESLRKAGDEAVKSSEADFRKNVAAAGFTGTAEWLVKEVAHFGGGDFGPLVEPETNFWGVYLHDLPADGNTYILGSDRDGGLWIFDTP